MNKNIERLIALTASLLEAPARPYMVGDKVVLKEGLGNLRYPKRGQIGIVTAVLAEPIYDQDRDAGSNAYRRKLDMKIAVFTENGDLEEFHVDSRRFRLAADVDMARDDQAFSPFGRLLQAAAEPRVSVREEYHFSVGQWITPKVGPDAGTKVFLTVEVDGDGDPIGISLDDDGDVTSRGLRGGGMRPLTKAEFVKLGGTEEEFSGGGTMLQ